MSAQEYVHEKHRIEREMNAVSMFVRTWLEEFSLLTNSELEICIAFLVDNVTENSMEKFCAIRLLIPVMALKFRSEIYSPPKWRRFWNLASVDSLTKRFSNSNLILPEEVTAEIFGAIVNDLLSKKFA